MKKALAILASFGLVATSSFSVIACAEKVDESNINATLNRLESWFVDAQPTETGEGKTMIIAVGGRQNSDTLSYLATINNMVNGEWTTDANTLTSDQRVQSLDTQMSNYNSSGNNNELKNIINDNLVGQLRSPMVNWRDDPAVESVIAKNYLKIELNKAPDSPIEFHTILVDRIEQFWNTTTGRGFLNNILRSQITDFYEFLAKRDPEIIDNALGIPLSSELTDIVSSNARRTALTNDKGQSLERIINNEKNLGPWFFVVRSGKVVGVKTGFRNYYEFNKEFTDDDREKNSFTANSNLVKDTFSEFTESLGGVLIDAVEFFNNNFLNEEPRTITKSNYITKNSPTEAWNSKTSGTSNIEDINDPRGDGSAKKDNNNADKDKGKDNNKTPEKPKDDNKKPEEPNGKPGQPNEKPNADKPKEETKPEKKASLYHYSFLD